MDSLATAAAVAAVILVLLPLGAVFGYLVYKGVGSINWAFLTQTPSRSVKLAAAWLTPSPVLFLFC